MSDETRLGLDFVRQWVKDDMETGRFSPPVVTRFPPEPNGYLHIGHAKAICLDFGIATEWGGRTNLRFDDTNPVKEDVEYVDSIRQDIQWLGFTWEDREFYASDYFEQLYEWAAFLIKEGLAYVDEQSPEEISQNRGTPTLAGKPSPFRDRPVDINLELFQKMKEGSLPDGAMVLRAKIDMAHPNLNMRDPVMYRIKHAHHHRTGDTWCIYPMYDWAHGQSDAIEGVTHSICTLEFENHRPLYNWFLEQLEIPHPPRQIEFNRLNLSFTMMSKRKLLDLVQKGLVKGWDDPRMPTLTGIRRRGYPPSAIRAFVTAIGVSKTDGMIELSALEYYVREELNRTAPRVMVVLNPLKVVLTNWPVGKVESLPADNNPEDGNAGTRTITFGRELYIEAEDFLEDPPKKFFRLSPGKEVRLKHGYIIACNEVVKNTDGSIAELRCTYDPDSRSGEAGGRKVKGTLHWVHAADCVEAEVRLYSTLFTKRDMGDIEEGKDYTDYLNPESLTTVRALGEPAIRQAKIGLGYQFLRHGYFTPDSEHFSPEVPVFNRTVTLKDTWAKIEKRTEN
ncbi:MAG: glutamine--tRNA ligase/YqeY domain fusion protein [Spirochaetales bacterium]|nr:glutamine--tRNA ligase/YqeY domain fusion protein [Spirochaetales bacterium]